MATLLWFSGAETGHINEFPDGPQTVGAGGGSIVSTPVRSGTYSLETETLKTAAVDVAGIGGNTVTYFRGYFKIGAFPSASQGIIGLGTTNSRFWVFLNTDGTIGYVNAAGAPSAPTASGADVISTSAWNLIEVQFKRDASVGGMEVYLNGVLQTSDFTSATTTSTSTSKMRIKVGDVSSANGGQTIHWDDMAYGTGGYIGEGQSAKVQGKAGAPTYDTWTKSSGTSAAALWSDTPFNATTECHSIVTNDRQTMLVDDTALTTAIGAGDTINGCAVVAVITAASGSPTFKIMRRVAGVDTTSATRFTSTVTGFRPRGVDTETFDVFTASLTDLSTAEIGAVCNSSTISEIIADMWLLIDFTPTVVPSLTLAVPLPIETLGAPVPTLSTVLPLPIETAGKDPAALDITFSILTAVRSPLLVTFDILAIPDPYTPNPLLVTFDIQEANPDGLTVTFNIVPQDLITARTTNDIQAPVATAVMT